MTIQTNPILRLALTTAALLLVPLVAMQFTNEVQWDLGDFIFAAIIIFGTGLAYQLVVRRQGNSAYRLAVGVALAAGFMLVWSNVAVGLIGSEDVPANGLYIGVLLIGIVGAALARLRPQGMARTLFAMALAQAAVPVIALLIWKSELDLKVVEVIGVTGFFVVFWLTSAWLFRRASNTDSVAKLVR